MEQTVVTATTTRALGTRPSRRLRREGQLPGVLYGLGREPVNLHVDYVELREALKTEAGLNTVFSLAVDGQQDLVLVKDVQRDPVRREVIHVDFLRIDAAQAITVEVPIRLVGEAEEVLAAGLLIEQALFALAVECSPTSIPDSLDADISILTPDRNITVADLTLPSGVTTDVDGDDPVVYTIVPRAEVEEEVEVGIEGEEGEAEEPAEASDVDAGGRDASDEG
jgi:large subunit ribosomal protein L25